jgi:hypothetical protein
MMCEVKVPWCAQTTGMVDEIENRAQPWDENDGSDDKSS